MGDPSGVGPVIIAKALPPLKGEAEFVIIGDKRVFNRATDCRLRPTGVPSEVEGPIADYHFIDLNNVSHKNFQFGKLKAEYGRASIAYLDTALDLIRQKEIDCLVTCPISKEAVAKSGLHNFRGHTDYLAERTNTKEFVMMLLNKSLRFSLVTRHIPLGLVSRRLSSQAINRTIEITFAALRDLFSIRNPRLVVCGVNPHASDNGLIGEEENMLIKPTLKRLRRRFRFLDGPLPADIAILRAALRDYDCVIALYHDQALIPLKLSGGLSGVNMTLGLPFVRTSPLHGVAFDVATRAEKADASSLVESIRLAIKCTSSRKNI